MTREEVIEKAYLFAFLEENGQLPLPELMADFALSVMPRWIPVTERLPEEKDANKWGMVLIEKECGWHDVISYTQVKILAKTVKWQPLSVAPVKEESK